MATLKDLEFALHSASHARRDRLSTAMLMQILEENLPEWEEIAPHVPHERPYGRVTLFEDHGYEVMIGCWDKGDWCDAHDHGPSEGAVYSYSGEIEHTSYLLEDGALTVTERSIMKAGMLMPLPHEMIHSLSNTSSDTPYIGLHLYSPPTKDVRVFHLPSGDIYHITNDHGAWVPTDPEKIRRIERNAFTFKNLAIESEVEG